MSFEIKEPPLKRRKLDLKKDDDSDDGIVDECIWCKKTENKDEGKTEKCVCNEIGSLLKSSKCHEMIEIKNTGNSNTSFKTYKLMRDIDDSENNCSFQINCKNDDNDDIDLDSVEFQNKLKNSLNRNGILILRDFLHSKDVLNARYDILTKYLSSNIEIDKDDKDKTMKAKYKTNAKNISLLNKAMEIIQNTKSVKNVLENDKLFKLISILLSSAHIITTKYKWLRAVKPSLFTGLHYDKMYMGLGFKQMLSIWIPIGDVSMKDGSLIWCYGSHNCLKWKSYLNSINYGDPNKLNKDGTTSGWITDKLSDWMNDIKNDHGIDHFKSFCTTDFKAGDIAIFGLDLIHQTLRNDSDCYRISCDTRWQPLCQPLDHRLKNCGISRWCAS